MISSAYSYDRDKFHYYHIEDYLAKDPEKFPISVVRGFGLYLTQQYFVVNAEVDIYDIRSSDIVYNPTNVLVLFINSITESQVIFQNSWNEVCDNLNRLLAYPSINPTGLDIVFYESPTLQTASSVMISPITVRNVAFAGYRDTYGSNAEINILKVSGKLSHEVLLENVPWCLTWSLMPLVHAQNLFTAEKPGHGVIRLNIVDSSIFGSDVSHISTIGLIDLINIDNAIMSGVNYFVHGKGGSVINTASSKLYVTGDLTIANGCAYQGGGIRLDSSSTLFLKEPLVARFYNNSAMEGNAIYAPNNGQKVSGIQILPSRVYSLDNMTDLDILLIFGNNTYFDGNEQRSLYALSARICLTSA